MRISIVLLLAIVALVGCTTTTPHSSGNNYKWKMRENVNFKNTPASVLLEEYSQASGKEVLIRAGVHASLSFRGAGRLDRKEYLKLIERHLNQKNIVLVPDGKNRLVAQWKK